MIEKLSEKNELPRSKLWGMNPERFKLGLCRKGRMFPSSCRILRRRNDENGALAAI